MMKKMSFFHSLMAALVLTAGSGSFSQRSVFNANEGKAYIGVNTADEQCIYIYDVATGTVTKGVQIAAGYYFDQIRLFED